MVACATVFLLFVFLFKIDFFSNLGRKNQGLSAGDRPTILDSTVEDLVSEDTDADGVFNWEEALWGTDPKRKDTDENGVPDDREIAKLKSEQGEGLEISADSENLTETDKFSREFFSTIAALSQNGVMDATTIEKLSSSLFEKIQNSPQRKVFNMSDLKVISDNQKAMEAYLNSVGSIQKKYLVNYTVYDVLQKFIVDENNVDIAALEDLDPVISSANKIIDDLIKTAVPQSLAPMHLKFINSMERLAENVSDIKLYDTDVIVSLSAIGQYTNNTDILSAASDDLVQAINEKLAN